MMKAPMDFNLDLLQRKEYDFVCGKYNLKLGRNTLIMGVLNATNDSFSGDGIFKDPERAKARAWEMIEEGADIIDIGGESTRPGAYPISAEEEKERILPLIRSLAKEIKIPISIDTTKSKVAQAALDEGASIINDISGFSFDLEMAKRTAKFNCGCILMHIKGTPQNMQDCPIYETLIDEIIAGLQESIALVLSAGINQQRIAIDPGIGFGKTTQHNLEIIKNLKDFSRLNLPILIGTSRKSFIGNVLDLSIDQRLLGTAASVACAICHGAHIVRVHDVKEMLQITKMTDAILNA